VLREMVKKKWSSIRPMMELGFALLA